MLIQLIENAHEKTKEILLFSLRFIGQPPFSHLEDSASSIDVHKSIVQFLPLF
jgi:hypothetical protein